MIFSVWARLLRSPRRTDCLCCEKKHILGVDIQNNPTHKITDYIRKTLESSNNDSGRYSIEIKKLECLTE